MMAALSEILNLVASKVVTLHKFPVFKSTAVTDQFEFLAPNMTKVLVMLWSAIKIVNHKMFENTIYM